MRVFDKMILQKIKLVPFEITGSMEVDDTCSNTCQLCGKQNIKYNYEIQSLEDCSTLWIGSECVKNEDLHIPGLETPEAREQYLKLIKDKYYENERRRVLNTLPPSEFINSVCAQYLNGKTLSYSQAAWLMKGILTKEPEDAQWFEGNLRFSRIRYYKLSPHLRQYVTPWFTNAQRSKLIQYQSNTETK